MTHLTQAMSPLRQRMIEDMRMRKFSPKTQKAYIRSVRRFAAFLGCAPDSASDENLRRYQLHLVVQGISPISLNATISAGRECLSSARPRHRQPTRAVR